MHRLVIGLMTDSKEVHGGRCLRGSDGNMCFSEMEGGNVWKGNMERIMNDENDLDHVEGDAVEVPVVCVSRGQVLQALNENRKSPWTFHSITRVDWQVLQAFNVNWKSPWTFHSITRVDWQVLHALNENRKSPWTFHSITRVDWQVLQALNENRKSPGPSIVSLELIPASGGVGIQVMAEICQKVLDGFGMPVEWAVSISVTIIKWKGNIMNCSCYRVVKLLEHGMKVMESVL